jgi:hypothetical protein
MTKHPFCAQCFTPPLWNMPTCWSIWKDERNNGYITSWFSLAIRFEKLREKIATWSSSFAYLRCLLFGSKKHIIQSVTFLFLRFRFSCQYLKWKISSSYNFLQFTINYQHLVSKHSINKLKNVKQNVLKTLNGLELMFSLLLNHLLNWAF